MLWHTHASLRCNPALVVQPHAKVVMQFMNTSLAASNNTQLESAASSTGVGRPDQINHTHGSLLSINAMSVCVSMFLCLWTPTHSVTFGRAQRVAQRGVGCINILLIALLASLSPGRPAEMSSGLLFSLINSVWERGWAGMSDRERKRSRQHEGER